MNESDGAHSNPSSNPSFVNAAGDGPAIADPAERKATLAAQRRYGITDKGFGYRWQEHDERFAAARNPNEANRFGWVVEIDPFDPKSQPVKHSALGRFKHEGAFVTLTSDSKPAPALVLMYALQGLPE